MEQSDTQTPEVMLDMTAAAKALNISYATILRWMKKGYIGFSRSPSGRKRIPKSEIERMRAEMTHEPGARDLDHV